jgi:putative iron-dependent peroxidase
MKTSQAGIFALGTSFHAYLEFDVLSEQDGLALVKTIASLREPRTTVGGVNLVSGFRPELWSKAARADAPAGVEGFNESVVGLDGFAMPATQHDAMLWISGGSYDIVFDVAHQIIAALDGLASVAEETTSWPYHHHRDLTGFIDGTENPPLVDVPNVAFIPQGQPGEGGTILLLQKWVHDAAKWKLLAVEDQERVMGRTKPDSIEIEDKAPDSHVASTDQDRFGHIFRRNMPYGTATNHGTMFVGFSAEQKRLSGMLDSMAGRTTGVRDALTHYTRPLTGAYYFVPAAEDLRDMASDEQH